MPAPHRRAPVPLPAFSPKAKEALVQKAVAAAKANDTSQFSAAIKQVQATAGQGDAPAQSIGLTECAKNPQPQG
jgi:hypothetical protein